MALSIGELFEANREPLQMEWIAGAQGADRRIARPARAQPAARVARQPDPPLRTDDTAWLTHDDSTSLEAADLVGHLNLVHPGRIHVFGQEEADYVARLGPERRRHIAHDLIGNRPPAIIYADGLVPDEQFVAACNAEQQPLLSSRLPSARVIDSLRAYLTKALAQPVSKHGVFLDVLGMGVLISGESGLGKSELALELISRGHGLVADDVIDLTRVGPHTVEGRCPPILQNFLEVRGLGLLDIRTIFGETAVRRKMRLKLIVHLVRRSTMEDEYERLPLEALTEDVLGVPIRKVVIPVAAGRNLAVLVEAAVRNTILQLRGIDSTRSFVQQQRTAIERGDE